MKTSEPLKSEAHHDIIGVGWYALEAIGGFPGGRQGD